MKILVTGGAGYIGSHTAKALKQAGFEPVVLDNLSAGYRHAVRWGPLVEGSIRDENVVRHSLKSYDIGAVIHFAGEILVGESMTNPHKYFWNNAVGTLTLLDTMLAAGVKHIVFSSSAATYGDPIKTPIPEDHPQTPVNPYGESKLMVERILQWYAEAYDLSWAALRYFNASGADPGVEIGEMHRTETHLIPLVILAALDRKPPVKVFGTDYPTPDGTAIRDYIHVSDLADAHVRMLQHLLEGGESTALNLGTGNGNSVREVIAAVGKMCDGRVPYEDAPRRAGDPPVLVADPSRARRLLDWTPQYSGLDFIVRTAWKWHESN